MKPAARIALLLALYLALSLLPLALAAWQPLPRRPWLSELSSGLAMAGFAILLLEFALSGRSALEDLLLGSVTLHTLASADCDVLVVPASARGAPAAR